MSDNSTLSVRFDGFTNDWEQRKASHNVPAVRFKADDGSEFPAWEEETVGDLFVFVSSKNTGNTIDNVITNSAEFGLIPQRDFFDKDIAVEGRTENYTIIHKGDFVYNPRKSTTAPYGPFNMYSREEIGIVSPLYTCLTPINSDSSDYLAWYFQTDRWFSYIVKNGAQGGARHDRVGMTNELMKKIPVQVPSLPEQKKIASLLSSIDYTLNLCQRKVDLLTQAKKALLQCMFPKQDGMFPELRFQHFSGNWKQRSVKDFCEVTSGEFVIKTKQDDSYPYPVYNGGRTNTGYYSEYNQTGRKVIISARGAAGFVNRSEEPFWAGNSCYSIAARDETDWIFLYFALKIKENNLIRDQQTATIPSVSKKQVLETKIKLPSLLEQQKISSVLSSFDSLITQAQAELKQWKLVKKSLLQQMFV